MSRYKRGDLVEVLSEREILATLDGRGALDGLPFMPAHTAGQTQKNATAATVAFLYGNLPLPSFELLAYTLKVCESRQIIALI